MPPRRITPATFAVLAFLACWLVAVALWRLTEFVPPGVFWAFFSATIPLGAGAIFWATRPKRRSIVRVCATLTIVYVLWWQWAIFAAHAIVWDAARAHLATWGAAGLFLIGLGWTIRYVDRAAQQIRDRRLADLVSRPQDAELILMPPNRREELLQVETVWNPLDERAWYYGRRNRKLNQSLATLLSYSLLYLLAFILIGQARGCSEIFELPSGGGEAKALAQTVKIQKVIRTKYVVNPLSSIKLEVPPIEEVKLQLAEATEHTYRVGFGEGEGAGFGAGTARGKVRFIRLEYAGGDWDQDMGVGADLNMLLQYHIRTGHKTHDRTESR